MNFPPRNKGSLDFLHKGFVIPSITPHHSNWSQNSVIPPDPSLYFCILSIENLALYIWNLSRTESKAFYL